MTKTDIAKALLSLERYDYRICDDGDDFPETSDSGDYVLWVDVERLVAEILQSDEVSHAPTNQPSTD